MHRQNLVFKKVILNQAKKDRKQFLQGNSKKKKDK